MSGAVRCWQMQKAPLCCAVLAVMSSFLLELSVDGEDPCRFALCQIDAANWSHSDITKWALNAVCYPPPPTPRFKEYPTGLSCWDGSHQRLVSPIHTCCICSYFQSGFFSASCERFILNNCCFCSSRPPVSHWRLHDPKAAAMNESQRDANTSRII